MTSAQLSFLDSCDDVPGVTTGRRRLTLFGVKRERTFVEQVVQQIHWIVNDVMSRVDDPIKDDAAAAIRLRLQNKFDDTSVPVERRPAWNVVIGTGAIAMSAAVEQAGSVLFCDERHGELVLVWMS